MDPSSQAASRVYDIDTGLASTTGKGSIAACMNKSAMKYIHKEGKPRSRLIFDSCGTAGEKVGPGSYDLGAWGSIAAAAQKHRGRDTHYMRSATRKVESADWDATATGAYRSRLRPIATELPPPEDTLQRLGKLPNGRFGPGTVGRVDMDGVVFTGRQSPTLLFPFTSRMNRKQRPGADVPVGSGRAAASAGPAPGAAADASASRVSPRKGRPLLYLTDRDFKPKAKKRARDVIPEDYFILAFDRKNGVV